MAIKLAKTSILFIIFLVLTVNLVYKPKKDITPYELSKVIEVVIFDINRYGIGSSGNIVDYYNTLEPGVKRHFYIRN